MSIHSEWNEGGQRGSTYPASSSFSNYAQYSEPRATTAVAGNPWRSVRSLKSKWTCRICGKTLSSKRSFDEHSNIHNRSRPFQCEHCDYAAASQMTLRRHNLRNHTPRQAWGYHCPYCSEQYMEPASYQQHVASRHFGKSATFGCPSEGCSFTTRCSLHFFSHISKHRNFPRSRFDFLHSGVSLASFIVDDKLGVGYGKLPLKQKLRRALAKKIVEKQISYEDYMKTPLDCSLVESRADRAMKHHFTRTNDKVGEYLLSDPSALFVGDDWMLEDVGMEVVVDDSEVAANILHEGMVEPELD